MHDVYEELRRRGAVGSERAYSRDWLGRAPNHLCDTRGRLSPATMVRLYLRLVRLGHRDLAARVWARLAGPSP